MKRYYLISSLAAGLGMWILAGIWHKLIMVHFYTAETGAKHEGTFIILIAYLILSTIMTYIFPLGYQGGKALVEGAKFGILMGVLWVFPHELAMAGAHGESLVYVFKNALWHAVEQGLGGVIIAIVYSRLKLNKYDTL